MPKNKLARPEDYPPGEYGLPHMGAVIADHRMKAGWTSQEAFAIVCGVDKQTVAYWENKGYLSDMDRRIFLCKLLKIPPVLLGLTAASLTHEEREDQDIAEILLENGYALYEDILRLSYTSTDQYSPTAVYRFQKHQQELEHITRQAKEREKEAWMDLLCRYYQHSTSIAQHQRKDKQALSLANQAVHLAQSLHDTELIGSTLYRRTRTHLIQNRQHMAKEDIQSALHETKRACRPLKGSCYLLAAEVHALYTDGDEKLKTLCRKWQNDAANLLYKGELEDDGTFLTFNLYAVNHERAKTLLRFALFHTTDDELVTRLKDTHIHANKSLLRDARNALLAARKHLESSGKRKEMYLSITEARMHLVAREFEESARTAKHALDFAHKGHSKQGVEEIRQIYSMLYQLEPKNPYVAHLGVELGIFPG